MVSELVISSFVSHLSCSVCGQAYRKNSLQHLSICCQKPLIVNYDHDITFRKEDLLGRENNMWRYQEMLPLENPKNRVTLGEGMTPIISIASIADKYGFDNLMLKDEGLNPTGSFKARGMSMAISKAKELGITECIVPTAGNAGGAMSAYCASAGIKATIIMPTTTPRLFQDECVMYGAKVILVDGLIDKCGEMANDIATCTGAFNMATLREPYRLEGKKTMGYEIAEQLGWKLPDVILYPTGGGTGLIGIWKAFHEMISLGWIDTKLPRMIAVQSSNCSPVVDRIAGREPIPGHYRGSVAGGLAVPKVIGLAMIEQVIEESNGTAVTVSEKEILAGTLEIRQSEGIAISLEGGAIWAALKNLVAVAVISPQDKILLLNTGSGYKALTG
jgi:threonine synthase